MTETQTSSSTETTSSSNDQSSEAEEKRSVTRTVSRHRSSGTRLRRHSRRRHRTSIVLRATKNIHYIIGFLLLAALIGLTFNSHVNDRIWRWLHPSTKATVQHSSPAWWFRAETISLFLALLIWLYLMPGVSEWLLSSFGLKKKNKDRHSRHQK